MATSDRPGKGQRRPRRFGLPSSARLHRRRDFLRLYKAGARASKHGFLLLALPNDLGGNRLGVSVTRKHGGAVVRNRIRRSVKEAFRLENPDLPAGFDIVCIPPRRGFDVPLDRLRPLIGRLARSACRKAAGTDR